MHNAWDSGIRVNIKNTVDTSKIQKLACKAACNILVGFPSGEMHVTQLHRKDKKSDYKTYEGGDAKDMEPIENAELAKMLSFGTSEIPARPFLDQGIESKEKELAEALKSEAKKVIDGGQANWNKVGTMAVGAVRDFVYSDYYRTNVPNSQKTIDYKGSDKPLIDSANLIGDLKFVVQAGGK